MFLCSHYSTELWLSLDNETLGGNGIASYIKSLLTSSICFMNCVSPHSPCVSLWDRTLGLVTLISYNVIMVTPFTKVDCFSVFLPCTWEGQHCECSVLFTLALWECASCLNGPTWHQWNISVSLPLRGFWDGDKLSQNSCGGPRNLVGV